MASSVAPFHSPGAEQSRSFAISSLGRGRWYWVVWPSPEEAHQAQASAHLAEGFAGNKLEAIEQALAAAGENAQWLAAGDAHRYYKSQRQSQVSRAVAQQEFLYYDVRLPVPGGQKQWQSLPYLIVKRSAKYVYITSMPYALGEGHGH